MMRKNFTNHMRAKRVSRCVFFACALAFVQSPQLLEAAPVAAIGNVAFQERVTVKGAVRDAADNQPLPGVTVTDNQRKVLGVTNADGNFTVSVEKGTELTFNMVGYAVARYIATSNQNNVNIRMASSSNSLN